MITEIPKGRSKTYDTKQAASYTGLTRSALLNTTRALQLPVKRRHNGSLRYTQEQLDTIKAHKTTDVSVQYVEAGTLPAGDDKIRKAIAAFQALGPAKKPVQSTVPVSAPVPTEPLGDFEGDQLPRVSAIVGSIPKATKHTPVQVNLLGLLITRELTPDQVVSLLELLHDSARPSIASGS